MNGVEVLRAAIGFNHQLTTMIMKGSSSESLAHTVPGGTISPASVIYAHAIFAEDFFVHGMLQGKAPLFVDAEWKAKAGIPDPPGPNQSPVWAPDVPLDMEKFEPYQQAVFAAMDEYLAGLTDADLDHVLEGGVANGQKVGQFLATIGVFHVGEHLGEIAALKGIQGLKGLPF